jgi:hypothetical protein
MKSVNMFSDASRNPLSNKLGASARLKRLALVLVLSVYGAFAGQAQVQAQTPPTPQSQSPDFVFKFTIESEGKTHTLEGASELMILPSSYMISMPADEGRCVIHMLNFTTEPGPGTYDVENRDEVVTAAVCMLAVVETQERMVSKSGTFTITRIDPRFIQGHFDMVLEGPITGKEFRLRGVVASDNTPININFDSRNPLGH